LILILILAAKSGLGVTQSEHLIGSKLPPHLFQDWDWHLDDEARTFDKEEPLPLPLPLHELIFSYRDYIPNLENIKSQI
jgi:hypothetical protein